MSIFSRTFVSLTERNYRLFFIGQLLNQTGTWMQRFAQAWLVLELTDSGTWLGLTLGIQMLPILFLSPLAGYVADRFSKRKILIATAVLGSLPALTLGSLTLTDHVSVAGVLALAFAGGVFDAVEKPARQALPSEMVAPERLTNAVILANVVQDGGKAMGPAIAGLAIELVGMPTAFFINGVSYFAVIVAVVMMHESDLHFRDRAKRGKGQVRAGLAYVRRTPQLLGPLALLAAAGVLAFNFPTVIPLLGSQTFGADAGQTGALLGAFGAGSIVGGISFAGFLQPSLSRIIVSAFAFGALFVATGLSPTLAVAYGLVFLLGVGSVVYKTASTTWVQLTADPLMRGRVVSLLILALAGSTPIGAPLMGWLAAVLTARWAFAIAGIGTIVAAVCAYAYLHKTVGKLNGNVLHDDAAAPTGDGRPSVEPPG